MERYKILERIAEIQDNNYKFFKGSNEADLHTREDIADFVEELLTSEGKNDIETTTPHLPLAAVSGQSELLLAFAKYAMPDNYTTLALNNIVKNFLEEYKQ